MPEELQEAVFDRLKQDAERLVRAVKDLGCDEAVILLLEALLDVRRRAQDALLAEVETRLSHAVAREET